MDGYTPDQAVVTGLMPAWDKQITVYYLPLSVDPDAVPVPAEPVLPNVPGMPDAALYLSNMSLNADESIE